MTLNNRQIRFEYAGNGATTVFSFTDKFYGIDVYLSDDSDSSSALQVVGVDYTVADLDEDSGGEVTFTTAPASGFTVILESNTSLVQDTNYVSNTNFPAAEQETALDKNVAMAQENSSNLNGGGRVLKIAKGVTGVFDADVIPVPDGLIVTNSANNAFVSVPFLGVVFTGDMQGNNIFNMAEGVSPNDAVVFSQLANKVYKSVSVLISSTEGTRGVGEVWEAGGFRYLEASPIVSDEDITTSAGVKLYVVAGTNGYDAEAWGLSTSATGSDNSAALLAAVTSKSNITINIGTYLIGTGITIPSGSTVRFLTGAVLDIEASTIVLWNGGIIADPYQKIFEGVITTGTYSRTTNTPYTFSLQGSPKVEWASPAWFGASIDGVTDDTVEIYCALYFSNRCYCPAGTYLIGAGASSGLIELRLPNQRLWGAGDATLIKADGSANDGAVLAFRGLAPSTASGDPQEWMSGGYIGDISVDGADAANTNGIGWSFAKGCHVSRVKFLNIGRKALTMQYHCKGNTFSETYIEDSAQESGSTSAAVSFEGQISGIDYTAVGGVASTSDLLGEDVKGNTGDVAYIETSGYNYVVINNAIANTVKVGVMGDASGNGGHIIFDRVATDNSVVFGRIGDSERRFVYCGADTARNTVTGGYMGDCSGSPIDGYAVQDLGEDNNFRDFSFSHSNTNTTQNSAIRLNGARPTLINIECRACAETSIIEALSGATRAKIIGGRFIATSARPIRVQGNGSYVHDNYFDCSSSLTGIQIDGDDISVVGNEITGNLSARIKLSSGADRAIITGNRLPDGASATVQIDSVSNRFTSAIHSNAGDRGSSDHIPLGSQSIWVDATGDVRVGAIGIASDTGGTVVGTQS